MVVDGALVVVTDCASPALVTVLLLVVASGVEVLVIGAPVVDVAPIACVVEVFGDVVVVLAITTVVAGGRVVDGNSVVNVGLGVVALAAAGAAVELVALLGS